MKTKKSGKKLVLDKKTIANLNNKEMVTVNGGKGTDAEHTCPPHLTCGWSWCSRPCC